MAATKGDKPFRHLYTKRLSSLIAATGGSYGGWIVTNPLAFHPEIPRWGSVQTREFLIPPKAGHF